MVDLFSLKTNTYTTYCDVGIEIKRPIVPCYLSGKAHMGMLLMHLQQKCTHPAAISQQQAWGLLGHVFRLDFSVTEG